MGNSESSYGSESSSEIEGDDLEDFQLQTPYRDRSQTYLDESRNKTTRPLQGGDDSASSIQRQEDPIKINKLDSSSDDDKLQLEDLAKQMKEERERLTKEKEDQVEKETEMLKLKDEIQKMKEDQPDIQKIVEEEINEKLGEWDGNPYKTPLGHWIVQLPMPVTD